MTRWGRILLTLAALSGFAAVLAGAYARHGLTDATTQDWMKTGSSIGLIHALAVFAAVFVARAGGRRGLAAAVLLLTGLVLFSGSLYAAALGAPHAVLMATPVGGLAMMAGWLALAWACLGLDKTT
jgi:uncharacterized membrane protein YgdD (TMEM256/DUF423 family)